MADYVLYIHGANVRDPAYAKNIDRGLQAAFNNQLTTASVYWGDVSEHAEGRVLEQWQSSEIWARLCFPNLRSQMLLQLIGDGALYINRTIGAEIVARIYTAVKTAFAERRSGDRLHLITHSWGAVIVLDMLFAARWLEGDTPGREEVLQMRDALFGMGERTDEGVLLNSVTTMGSPMSLFSLMDSDGDGQCDRSASSHDISDTMQKYCRKLFTQTGTPLHWYNFIHPADAFAYPSAPLIRSLLKGDTASVEVHDTIVRTDLLDTILQFIFGRTDVAVLGAAGAHNGYWDNPHVIAEIARTMHLAVQAADPV